MSNELNSKFFKLEEFRCKVNGKPCPHCNGSVIVVPTLIEVLETIREYAGIPVQITSGYRCAAHNAEVGGKPNSAHLTGEAADFFVSGNKDRFKFIEAIAFYGPTRYGIGSDFIHVDVSATLPQEVAWGYWE